MIILNKFNFVINGSNYEVELYGKVEKNTKNKCIKHTSKLKLEVLKIEYKMLYLCSNNNHERMIQASDKTLERISFSSTQCTFTNINHSKSYI